MTLTAGIYNLPVEQYEADPTEEPSLRSSGIKRLLLDSPAAFAAYSPRLTRWLHLLHERSKRTDEGSVAHAIILGEGCKFIVAEPEDAGVADGKQILTEKGEPYKNWSGKALAWRKAKEALGFTIIDHAKSALAENAKSAVVDMLRDEYGDWPIGQSEQTVIWRRETEHGLIWCRARPDHWSRPSSVAMNLKTTELSISDASIRKMAENDGWYISAAWELEGLETVHPDLAGRLKYRFPIVQVVPPFDCTFFDPSEYWLKIGRDRNSRGANIFAKCLRDGAWPGRSKVASPEPSSWLVSQYEEEGLRDG